MDVKRLLLLTMLLVVGIGLSSAVEKSVQVLSTWLDYEAKQNGVNGIMVHTKFRVDGYTGQNVSLVAYIDCPKGVGHKDLNGKYCTSDGCVANYVILNAIYECSVWEDAGIFFPYDELHFKEGTHTYYCHVQAIMNDGMRGYGPYVAFDGFGPKQQNNPQNDNSGAVQPTTARYLGERTGKFYYISGTYQQGVFNFYYNDGNYLADAPGLNQFIYGAYQRYIKVGETGDFYKFKQAKIYIPSGKVEIQHNAPKMWVSKAWNKIICEKSSLDGTDMIFIKEVTKEEYDKISNNKQAYLNRLGIYNNGGNSGSSVNTDPYNNHVDGRCQYCGGGGGCSSCNGTGVKYNPYGGYNDTCPSCRGSGECFNCRGTGVQSTY